MSFVSPEFVLFFALVGVVYFALPQRFRWGWLLVASLVFYAYTDAVYLPLLLFSALVNFWLARRIAAAAQAGRRKAWLALGVTLDLSVLFIFKYFNFFNESLAALAESLGAPYAVGALNVALPLGVSFYTFQLVAYLADVYRGTLQPETHAGMFVTYVAFFPRMVAGPIERPGHFLPQLRARAAFDDARMTEGLRRILWGVFKKVVVADRLAIYVNDVYGNLEHYSGLPLLAATLFFGFQIYADFSAYTDIALGVAKVLGFDLMENFRQPYLAASVRDFWRRWHISLSSWFRDYLYFPLGGSRVPLPRTLANLMIVFVASGLWHGANWTFAVWGGLHGLYLCAETLAARLKIGAPIPAGARRFGEVMLTFALVTFAWVFFRAASLDDALYVVRSLTDFSEGIENLTRPFRDALFPEEVELALSLVLIGFTILADWIDSRWGLMSVIGRRHPVIRWALYYGLAACIGVSFWLSVGATQTFVYAQF